MPDFDPPAIEPVVDERTPNFDLPLVSKLNNSAQTDTHRLRSAIYKVDEELGKVKTASADTATPTQAGAKRDGSNDAPAVATWLATLRDSNLRGEATGKLTLSSRVVIDLSGTSPGEHLAIFGSGLNSQTFLVKNADGGLKFNGTGVGRQHSVVLDQVGIVPGQPNSGTAFEFVGSAGGLNNNNSVTLSHVQVGPLNEADPNDFADGIIIPRGYRSQLDHVRVMKATAPGVGSANLKWNSVVDVSETYFPRITDIWGNVVAGGAIYGIKSHGTDEEDISVNGALLNGADYALSYVRDSREPGGRFNDWESNSNVCNFYIDGAKHWTIVAPYLFCKRHVSGFKDIHIVDGDGIQILYPQFRDAGYGRRHVHLEPRADKEGAVVRNITIILDQSSLMAAQDVFLGDGVTPGETAPYAEPATPPIYLNGATGVTIQIPWQYPHADEGMGPTDFVRYPKRLIEFGPNQDPSEVRVITPDGVVSFDDGSAYGPDYHIYRNSASPANNDNLGGFSLEGNNASGNLAIYARDTAIALDVTAGGHRGRRIMSTAHLGALENQGWWQSPSASLQTGLWVNTLNGGVRGVTQVLLGNQVKGAAGARVLQITPSGGGSEAGTDVDKLLTQAQIQAFTQTTFQAYMNTWANTLPTTEPATSGLWWLNAGVLTRKP